MAPGVEVLLSEDQVFLQGHPAEAEEVVLGGKVVVDLSEETKIKSLSVKLTGKSKVSWKYTYNGETQFSHAKRNIVKIHKPLLPQTNKHYTLSPGKHEFNFELPFEGAFPETVHVKNGYVQYMLNVVMDRPFPRKKSTCSREIQIIRSSFHRSDFHLEPINIYDVWNGRIPYEITLPVKSFGPGDVIPVNIKHSPKDEGISLNRVDCHLIESITYRKPETSLFTVERRTLRLLTDAERFHGVLEKNLQLPIPTKSNIHIGCCTELIKIQHKLKMHFKVDLDEGEESFSVEFPIIIMSASNHDLHQILPVYTSEQPTNPYARRMSLPPSYEHINLMATTP
ncbi:hypothetical protein K493DRAFT_355886 [Basidiobolus meristosporus CBS 931.73]|uniref:Arrestin C-terminal-like domain-containing protein n=1 Tax=Basidiobolus meristosporus CBS 931.73 TaxID=1314790 RepID=A0A1Y1XZR2_9FUNG|nr:hypothetical protein K493DRAFT_355886 [Basidiobolus meristosporus CBS 931.73]|eukprot:ORX91231.1 hypothetical protein K493DRAFT_355886 [Basidiobolus meristosporus CBS 931.73]